MLSYNKRVPFCLSLALNSNCLQNPSLLSSPDFYIKDKKNKKTLNAKASDSFVEAEGIYTGEDMYRILEMGTSGIQMGTRFVATTECDVADAFKNQKHQ